MDWSLISGPVPAVLLVAGCAAFGFLLTRRRDRRWWAAVAVVVVGTVGAVAAFMVALMVVAPFPDPVPALVWWAVGAGLAAVGLGGALIAAPHGRRRPPALAAAVVVVLAAAGQVNGFYGQFPTPRAALGLPAVGQVDFTTVAPVGAVLVSRAPGRSLAERWRPPAGLPATGSVARVAIPGRVSGFPARPAWLYLPPAYLSAPRAQLPVLVALSGQPGTPRDWLDGGRLAQQMDTFAAAHGGLAPVVVMPDPLGSTLANPLCLDSRLGRAHTYLSVDVPAWTRATLQIDPAPDSWAVAGVSAGGTCALQLALTAPQVFPVFVDISGQSAPTLGDRRRTIAAAFDGDTAAFTAVNPLDLLTHHRYPDTTGFVLVGRGDGLYRPQAVEVARAARAAGAAIDYRELSGGHDWHVGAAGLEAALPWLATRLHLTG